MLSRCSFVSSFSRQRGLTLVELMVGLTVGLIVIGGVMTVYLAVINSSGDTLKSGKLNQEMGAIMSVMANDIRRAGIWGEIDFDNLQNNPYSQVSSAPNAKDGTVLEIHDSMASDTNQVTTTSGTVTEEDIYLPNGVGSCIVYAYDRDSEDGGLQDIDLFGFRLNGTAVEMREEGDISGTINSCNNGTWGEMNDTNVVSITRLEFDMRPVDADGDGVTESGSTCLISNEPNGHDEDGDDLADNDSDGDGYPDDSDGDGIPDDYAEQNCYETSPYASLNNGFADSYVTTETRVVTIIMEGELVDDSEVTAELKQTVRVRNDLLRVFE